MYGNTLASAGSSTMCSLMTRMALFAPGRRGVCTLQTRCATTLDGIVVRGSGGGERASVLSVLSRREVELTLSYTRDR
jgi:hypothetical protein